MGGRHKNVEDPSTRGRDIRKTKYDPLGFFLTPFSSASENHVEDLSGGGGKFQTLFGKDR
jgi:hypothetical protein